MSQTDQTTTTELTGVCPDTHKGGATVGRWMAVLKTTHSRGTTVRYFPLYPATFLDRANALRYAEANLPVLLSEANLGPADPWLAERARPLPVLPGRDIPSKGATLTQEPFEGDEATQAPQTSPRPRDGRTDPSERTP